MSWLSSAANTVTGSKSGGLAKIGAVAGIATGIGALTGAMSLGSAVAGGAAATGGAAGASTAAALAGGSVGLGATGGVAGFLGGLGGVAGLASGANTIANLLSLGGRGASTTNNTTLSSSLGGYAPETGADTITSGLKGSDADSASLANEVAKGTADATPQQTAEQLQLTQALNELAAMRKGTSTDNTDWNNLLKLTKGV